MSAKAIDYRTRLSDFMTEHVFGAEADYDEALNCAAPDTGNMEILHMFGTEQQRAQWLRPLLDGKIRSAFSMTEPAVASSDARNIETTISRDGADYVINGRKWWTSGAADPRCKILIVMGRTNPDAAAHQQQSMVLVPIDTPGVTMRRSPEMAVRELPGAWNFRDVADTATALRPGRLFRSSELSRLDDAGRATLRRLGITDVADLRSSREVARRGPGRVPDGIDVHLLPFPDLADDDADDSAPHETAFKRLLTNDGSNGESGESSQSINDAATRYMTDEYRQFPTRNGAQRALHRVVTLLAAGRPVLTHCFAGKDRTGFVVALVLEAVGLDRDVIVADYLRSNDSVPQLRARISEMIQQRFDTELAPEVVTFTKARLSDGVLGVRAEYLAAARQTIDETYGSLGGYLRDAGISQATVNRMRGVLLG